MNNASVTFRDNEQSKKVFQLFTKVLNDIETLESLSMDTLKQSYGFSTEDAAIFFELMAKYLSTKVKVSEEEKQPIR